MIASTVESKYSLAKMRLEKGQGTVENFQLIAGFNNQLVVQP